MSKTKVFDCEDKALHCHLKCVLSLLLSNEVQICSQVFIMQWLDESIPFKVSLKI